MPQKTRSLRRSTACLSLLLLPALLALGPGSALGQAPRSNTPNDAEIAAVKARPAPARLQQLVLVPVLDRPDQIRRFVIVCTGSTEIDVAADEFGIPGDHWQIKVKAWDALPNTAVTSVPGPVGALSAPARVFNYGGTPFSKSLKALIEFSYLNGVDVFPAGTFMTVTSVGPCTAQDLGLEDRIDRTP